MAERLNDELPTPGRRRRYPWDEWLDGSTWLLEHGEDFTVAAETMRVMVYQNATKRGLKVTTELHGPVGSEDLKIRAYTPEPEEASA